LDSLKAIYNGDDAMCEASTNQGIFCLHPCGSSKLIYDEFHVRLTLHDGEILKKDCRLRFGACNVT